MGMPLKGSRAHIRRLQALPALTEREVSQKLFTAGELIEVYAAISITTGSVGGSQHQPSPVGQPPNADTNVLDRGIETTQPSKLRVRVTSTAPYSEPLEFGTSRMGARPFMRPARDAKRKEVQALVQQGLNIAVKKSRRSD